MKEKIFSFLRDPGAWDLSSRSALSRWSLSVLRALVLAGKRFRRDLCLQRAASLSFISLLSLIPIGFLFLFFMRAFHLGGYWEQLKDFLLTNLPEKSRDSVLKWLGEMEKDNLSSIGSLPYYILVITGLILSALWLFEASEKALNRIWRTTRSRSYVQRLTVFWLIVTASPFLLALSTFLRTSLEANPAFRALMGKAWLYEAFYGFFIPVAVATLAFFFVYLLLPAARVKVVPAVCGALLAALFWEIAKSALGYVIPRAVTFSVYGSLGAIAAFLLWFYVSWSVLLFGAQLSYVVQFPTQAALCVAAAEGRPRLPPGLLALAAAVEIARATQNGASPPSLSELSQAWSVPDDLLREEIATAGGAFFHRAQGEEEVYYLSRDSDSIAVTDLLTWPVPPAGGMHCPEPVAELLRTLRERFTQYASTLTVRDVLNRNFSLRRE